MSGTDEAWKQWGSQDPYFGVLTDPRFRNANLTAEHKAAFLDSGRLHVEHVMAVLRQHIDPAFAPKRILDFGCGVGRLVIPFARVAEHVTGIDVSEGMLAEARRNCDAAGVANVSLALSDDPLAAVEGPFDLVHSVIVFQHIEPKRGVAIFRRLLDSIAPCGAGAVHFTYAKTRYAERHGQPPAALPWFRRIVRALRRKISAQRSAAADPEMQMNVYPLNELLFLLQSAGVREIHAEFSDHGGELAAFIFFRRP